MQPQLEIHPITIDDEDVDQEGTIFQYSILKGERICFSYWYNEVNYGKGVLSISYPPAAQCRDSILLHCFL